MSRAVSLGIDLGTSELKALLLDDAGVVLGHTGVRLSISRPHTGWSEQNPQDWWIACVEALLVLRNAYPDAWKRIHCIGLSGQMHGAVLLDKNDQVLRPAILWDDARAAVQAGLLHQNFPDFAGIIGSLPMAGLTAPKLLWLKEHEPRIVEALACVLSPKDYLRLKLAGVLATDYSDASGTAWLDVGARQWFPAMVEATGLSVSQLPPLIESNAASCTLTSKSCALLDLNPGIVVAGGCGDNPASSLGIGAVKAGDSFITLGTSAALSTLTDTPVTQPDAAVHSFCHALPGRWYTMGAMLSGASCLRWLVTLLGQPNESHLLSQVAVALPLEKVPAMSTPLFLPYLAGERTPHNQPHLRAGFVNLAHDTTPALLGYAVLEGVAFGLRDAMLAIEKAGSTVSRCALVGGGAKSDYWAQLLANVLDREIFTLSGSELGACIGAAKLGFAAIDADHIMQATSLSTQSVFTPNATHSEVLLRRFEKFVGLYPALNRLV
ncbi:xylulokinase [Pseudomonas sp. TAE6080]|uniref:xylulokinase n=1 Tax=Pseudomonas sp. TAE6080 TaxID=2840374 RepID=UPI001BFFE42A|nr:xylulokinase [Pseudomonas sp. TAE6080]MBT9304890.1 xylulokinase [Pseudomonas sp. TAE6080]